MKILLTATMVLLTGCITSEEKPPVQDYKEVYYQNTTVCVIMFAEKAGVRRGTECTASERKVAIGFRVEPIKGECEPAFFTMNNFSSCGGCE